jgi:hypothetical protein
MLSALNNDTYSLWTIISGDLCQTVVLHSIHVSIPLSSDIDPFNYILNSAQLLKLVTAHFVSKRFPMYRPSYLHLCGSGKLLGMGCSALVSDAYVKKGRTLVL